jgi:hypothetical protein
VGRREQHRDEEYEWTDCAGGHNNKERLTPVLMSAAAPLLPLRPLLP